jgi:hypothetical protein
MSGANEKARKMLEKKNDWLPPYKKRESMPTPTGIENGRDPRSKRAKCAARTSGN